MTSWQLIASERIIIWVIERKEKIIYNSRAGTWNVYRIFKKIQILKPIFF
jgi:hypothetical protein